MTTAPQTSESLLVSGAVLCVVRAGDAEKPAIVFLHAGVADSRMWEQSIQALAPLGNTVAYDRRGFGRTEVLDPTQAFSHIGDLKTLLDERGLKRPILVGCSQGGRVAIDYALAQPQGVEALVLVSSAVTGAPWPESFEPPIDAVVSAYEAADESGDVDALNEMEARVWLDGPLADSGRVTGAARELFLEMNRRIIELDAVALSETEPDEARRTSIDRVGEIKVPTLCVAGELDFPHITARSRWLAETIPGATLATMPSVAHLPPLEASDSFNALLVEFVQSLQE